MSQALIPGYSSELITYNFIPVHSELQLSPFLKHADTLLHHGFFTSFFFLDHSALFAFCSSSLPVCRHISKAFPDHPVYNHTFPFPVFPYLLNVLFPLHNTNILFIYTFIWLLSVTPCPNPTPPWRLSLWIGLGLSFLFSAVHLAPRMELGIW